MVKVGLGWHVETCRFHVRNVEKLSRFGHQKSRVFGHQKSYFLAKSGKVRKSEKSAKITKISKISKNQQNPEKVAKSRKSRKFRLFGTLEATLRIWSESPSGGQSGHFGGSVRQVRFRVRRPDFRTFRRPKKVQKFRLFDPPKKSKIWAGCRGDRSSLSEVVFALRRQKNSTFFDFFGGKAKKCTFFGNFERFCD